MGRFVFSLESILRYRLNFEKSAKLILAETQSKYQQQEKLMEEMYYKLLSLDTNSLANLEHSTPSSGFVLSVSGIVHENIYRDYLISCLNKGQALLAALEEEVTRCREKAVQARQERLILEKLKERSWQEYQLTEDKKEQDQIDEIGRGIFVSQQRRD